MSDGWKTFWLMVLVWAIAGLLWASVARAQCVVGVEGFVPQEGSAEVVKEVNPGCATGAVFTMTCLSPVAVAALKAKRTALKAKVKAADELCDVKVSSATRTAEAKGALDLESCQTDCTEQIRIIHEAIREVEGGDGMGWAKPLVVYAGSGALIATGIVLILKGEVDAVEKIGWALTGVGTGAATGFTVAVW